jgi:Ni/Co efflux regulator RcnB
VREGRVCGREMIGRERERERERGRERERERERERCREGEMEIRRDRHGFTLKIAEKSPLVARVIWISAKMYVAQRSKWPMGDRIALSADCSTVPSMTSRQ